MLFASDYNDNRVHIDKNGRQIGSTQPGLFGSKKTKWDKEINEYSFRRNNKCPALDLAVTITDRLCRTIITT